MVIYRVVENGTETVTVEENGVVTSRTVNSVSGSIDGHIEIINM